MSLVSRIVAIAAIAAVSVIAKVETAAAASYSFVGSWDVYNDAAPEWTCCGPDGPLAYTGQEAAALLFGGNASDYVISTISDMVADINFSAWYDIIGFGGNIFAQDYDNKYLGQFYGPQNGYDLGNMNNAASAFVRDNLQGAGAINYAFRIAAVPVPASLPLLLAGLGSVAALRRRASRRAA